MSGRRDSLLGRGARFYTHHLALKWRLMLMLSALIVVSITALAYVSYRIYTDNAIEMTIARKHEMGASVLEAITIIRTRDDYSADQIARSDDIMEALSYSGPQTEYLKFLEVRSCSKALMEIVDKGNIVGLAVLGKNGKSFFSKSETDRTNDTALVTLTDTAAVAASAGESVWIPSRTDIFSAAGGEPACLYVVKRLYSIRNNNGEDVGLSVAQVQYSRLHDILMRVMTGEENYAMLADRSNVILCTTQDQQLVATTMAQEITGRIDGLQGSFTVATQGQKVLYLYNRDSQSGWVLVQAVPYSVIQRAADAVSRWALLLTAICLTVALGLAWLFARTFTDPVVRLEKVMKRFGEGDLAVRSAADRSDEIGRLQSSFNNMAGQISGLLSGMEEEHKQKRQLEMRMMEYQINPHFLYNSLDSISWMARAAGNREIAEMATSLARFFRIGLNKGREAITVADEVEHARNYLIISKIRYHDGFSFDVTVDPDVKECKTIKLILQPLVENCLMHAIKKSGDGGHVSILAFPKGEDVVIEVQDNGRGIPLQRLNELRAMLNRKPRGDGYDGGIGLVNVQLRIRLNYGPEYGLTVDSEPGLGTTVRITIPRMQ